MVFHVMSRATHTLPTDNARRFVSVPSELHAGDQDEESIRLAISLQLEDIRNTHDVSTQFDEDDEAAVLGEYRRYLEDAERLFADRKFAETLAAGPGSPQMIAVDEPHVLGSRGTNNSMVHLPPPDSPRTLDTVVLPNNDVDLDMSDAFEEEIQLACAMSLEMYKEEQQKAEDKVCTWSGP